MASWCNLFSLYIQVYHGHLGQDEELQQWDIQLQSLGKRPRTGWPWVWSLQFPDLLDKPSRIWNCGESGFLLVLLSQEWWGFALQWARNVYHITGNSKQQITTLCCISAAGGVIPLPLAATQHHIWLHWSCVNRPRPWVTSGCTCCCEECAAFTLLAWIC